MSVLSDYKALVDSSITNQTTTYSITPTIVGNRLKELADIVPTLSTTIVPMGTILMYAPATTSEFDGSGLGTGSNVIGWAICNGANGTPDLKGKFVVGYNPSDTDYDVIGETGGVKTVTLDVTQIPAHVHPTTAIVSTGGAANGFEHVNTGNSGIENTNSTGGGLPHENRPPFYTVLYIKKIA